MSSNDSSSDLDSRIAAIVESTVGRVRDEMMHRMQDTESRLRAISGRLGIEEPAEPVAEMAQEPPPAVAPPTADAVSGLFDAVAAIDRGGSQQDVLAALLEGVGSFASRSALFLTRSDGAQGWGSYGFEDLAGEIQDVVLSYGEGPLAVLAEGRGCVTMSADECRDLCGRMGVSPGAEGLLVPFVLRDRLAAALYADRFPDGPPLARQQLQLLAYVGALAVEGLALRDRTETPTLQVAAGEAEAPGVALWEAPAADQPELAVETSMAEPTAPEPPPTVPEPPPTAPELTAPELTAPELTAPELTAPELTVPELTVPQPTEPPPTEPPPTEPHLTDAEPPAETTIGEMTTEVLSGMDVPTDVVSAAPPAVEPEVETAPDDEWKMPAAELDLTTATPEPAPPALAEEPAQALETPTEPVPAAPAEEAPAWAATPGDGFPTAEVEPTPAPAEPSPPSLDQPADAPSGTTEVRPPTDVSGPGWAFTASRAAAAATDDSQHEEARRLARLLVTEIKLYNEEQVEEGRRGKDIYARLREDIDRSRQIFNERVDEEVREQTDYFHEEMVRILAGGNEEALGL